MASDSRKNLIFRLIWCMVQGLAVLKVCVQGMNHVWMSERKRAGERVGNVLRAAPPTTLKTPSLAESCFQPPNSCILSNLDPPPLYNQIPQRPQAQPLRTRRPKKGLRTWSRCGITRRRKTENRNVRSPGDPSMSPGPRLGPGSWGLLGTPIPCPLPPWGPSLGSPGLPQVCSRRPWWRWSYTSSRRRSWSRRCAWRICPTCPAGGGSAAPPRACHGDSKGSKERWGPLLPVRSAFQAPFSPRDSSYPLSEWPRPWPEQQQRVTGLDQQAAWMVHPLAV